MTGYINQGNYMAFQVLNKYLDDVFKELKELKTTSDDFLSSRLIFAVEQHKRYVENMTNMLDGKIDWKPPKYTDCNFGKTYYSINKDEVKQMYGDAMYEKFLKIEEIHKEFHAIAEEIINRLHTDPHSNINTLLMDLATKSKMLVEYCRRIILLLR